MKKTGLVSVVLSTFNNKSTIVTCIRSIKRQTYSPIEIIIVDEWSIDGTDKIAHKEGARVYFHGPERAHNRNYGIMKAKGEYILVLDSDMELKKSVIEECINKIRTTRCDACVIPEESVGSGYWARVRRFERQWYRGDDSVEAARFFKESVIRSLKGYDPSLVGAEDWDLHQRLLKKFHVCRIGSRLIHHEGTLTLKRLLSKKMYYGRAFLEYKKRHPQAFRNAVLRTSILTNIHHFLLRPSVGVGVLFLKFAEGLALFYGMILAHRGKSSQHY